MNPWELVVLITGWAAVVLVVGIILLLVLMAIGVVIGVAKGNGTHTILSSRDIKKRRKTRE